MVGEIFVVNKYKIKEEELDGFKENIMRPSILGNPFEMRSEEDREIVVTKFYHYLREEFRKKGKVFERLNFLANEVLNGRDLYLICCCAPKLCHGEVIRNAIHGIINKNARS